MAIAADAFKYNHCVGSRRCITKVSRDSRKFKYNHCVGSSKPEEPKEEETKETKTEKTQEEEKAEELAEKVAKILAKKKYKYPYEKAELKKKKYKYPYEKSELEEKIAKLEAEIEELKKKKPEEEEMKKKKKYEYPEELGEEFEAELSAYTDFIKKYLKTHKGATIKEAAKAWAKEHVELSEPTITVEDLKTQVGELVEQKMSQFGVKPIRVAQRFIDPSHKEYNKEIEVTELDRAMFDMIKEGVGI